MSPLELEAIQALRSGRLQEWADSKAQTLTLPCEHCGRAVRPEILADWLWAYYGQIPNPAYCSTFCYLASLAAPEAR